MNLYHSGGLNAAAAEGTGGKRTSVATVASAMASQGATGCKVWWLKLQDLLYPLLRAFNWPIKMVGAAIVSGCPCVNDNPHLTHCVVRCCATAAQHQHSSRGR